MSLSLFLSRAETFPNPPVCSPRGYFFTRTFKPCIGLFVVWVLTCGDVTAYRNARECIDAGPQQNQPCVKDVTFRKKRFPKRIQAEKYLEEQKRAGKCGLSQIQAERD